MFSSVTTACRGRTSFRWNSGKTFQQETRPKGAIKSQKHCCWFRAQEKSYLCSSCTGWKHLFQLLWCCTWAGSAWDILIWVQLLFFFVCYSFTIQLTLFVCSIEPVLHAGSHSIGHSLHSFPLSFASKPQAQVYYQKKTAKTSFLKWGIVMWKAQWTCEFSAFSKW